MLWELSDNKRKEEYLKDAREAAKELKKECGHSKISGECLLSKEMCYYENQKLCPDYHPKYETNNIK